MKRFLRTFTSLLLSGAFTVMMAMPASADAYTFKNYERTDFISKDQFDKILQTLRNHSSEDASGASTNAYFTGVTYSSYEEAEKIINAFSDVYMGDDMYGIVKVPEGNWTWKMPGNTVEEAFRESEARLKWFKALTERTGRKSKNGENGVSE